MRTLRLLPALLVLLGLGCATEPVVEEGEPFITIGGSRPATLMRPGDYVTGTPIPVVILLHGYNHHARGIDRYFGISRRINADHFALILPEGTKNPEGRRFWNATDYCCDFYNTEPDDAGYLNRLFEEAAEHVTTDGVYLIGHSNGGFMAYRMACDSMPGLRGIASLAGTEFDDRTRCDEAAPVPVLHLHGTADGTIWYGGGFRASAAGDIHYPGAAQTVQRWAERAECDVEAAVELDPMDMVLSIPEAETRPLRYEAGCGDGVATELWTIDGGSHVPGFDSNEIGALVIAWLFG